MLKNTLFVISVLAATMICGFTLTSLIAATITLCATGWFNSLSALKPQTGYLVNTPENYNPVSISATIEKVLNMTLKTEKKLILNISNPGINTITIRINRKGALEICDSRRSIEINNGRVWIPDHPLPLSLATGERSYLKFKPSSDGRVRVSISADFFKSSLLYLLAAPLIICLLLNITPAAASLLAIILDTLLNKKFAGIQ